MSIRLGSNRTPYYQPTSTGTPTATSANVQGTPTVSSGPTTSDNVTGSNNAPNLGQSHTFTDCNLTIYKSDVYKNDEPIPWESAKSDLKNQLIKWAEEEIEKSIAEAKRVILNNAIKSAQTLVGFGIPPEGMIRKMPGYCQNNIGVCNLYANYKFTDNSNGSVNYERVGDYIDDGSSFKTAEDIARKQYQILLNYPWGAN